MMAHINRVSVVGVCVLCLVATAAQAATVTVTFDDATTPFSDPIPDGYAGLDWSNFSFMNTPIFPIQDSGYVTGTVSPNYIAWNVSDVTPSTISLSDGLFTFNSAYLTAAWLNGLNITIEGFAGASLLHSDTVEVGPSGPTLFTFNWADIDSLKFTASGGTDAGLGGGGTYFAMDNFTFTTANAVVVPLPAAGWAGLALLGMLGGTGAWRRNRKLAA